MKRFVVKHASAGGESEELDTLFARTVLLANVMTSQPMIAFRLLNISPPF